MNSETTKSKNAINHVAIESLSHDGRGIAKIDNKTTFIDNAVPGDIVDITITSQSDKFDTAKIIEFVKQSEERTEPFCQYYEQCGGCQQQHLSLSAQREWKNRNFITRLSQAINSKHLKTSEPITGDDKGYRRRARFGLVISKKDKQARLGFRQKQSNELIDIEQCPVLTDNLNKFLAENRDQLLALASRSEKEVNMVEADNGCYIHIEKHEETSANTETKTPEYQIENLKLKFPADGFVQVNAVINQKMVKQALEWLELEDKHKVLDLFCGVGNFTLPIAQSAQSVTGIEGLNELVKTASDNARNNQLENTVFHKANLFENQEKSVWFRKQKYDRVLLDPGRQGAFEMSKKLHLLKPEIIVYVSCNAATLIRDIKELQKNGYFAYKASLLDMFPHTTHTEVMVQLKKSKQPKKTDRKTFRF